jgi:hypothetical protein
MKRRMKLYETVSIWIVGVCFGAYNCLQLHTELCLILRELTPVSSVSRCFAPSGKTVHFFAKFQN